MRTKILVRNKRGTSEKTPTGGHDSWLDFWLTHQFKNTSLCCERYCNNPAEVGAHVIIDGEGGKEYIVGLCSKHNHVSNDELFWVLESDLVPVK